MKNVVLTILAAWAFPAFAAEVDVKCANPGLPNGPSVNASIISSEDPTMGEIIVINRLSFNDPNNSLGGSITYASLTDSNAAYPTAPFYTVAGAAQGRSGVLSISEYNTNADASFTAHFTQTVGGSVHVLHVTCRNSGRLP